MLLAATIALESKRSKVGKAPTFDGTGNMDSFLQKFGKWVHAKGLSPDDAAVALCSVLKGDAKAYEENIDYGGEPTCEAVTA